eukprot:PhF_6_TR40188/c0_g1_i1/m.59621
MSTSIEEIHESHTFLVRGPIDLRAKTSTMDVVVVGFVSTFEKYLQTNKAMVWKRRRVDITVDAATHLVNIFKYTPSLDGGVLKPKFSIDLKTQVLDVQKCIVPEKEALLFENECKYGHIGWTFILNNGFAFDMCTHSYEHRDRMLELFTKVITWLDRVQLHTDETAEVVVSRSKSTNETIHIRALEKYVDHFLNPPVNNLLLDVKDLLLMRVGGGSGGRGIDPVNAPDDGILYYNCNSSLNLIRLGGNRKNYQRRKVTPSVKKSVGCIKIRDPTMGKLGGTVRIELSKYLLQVKTPWSTYIELIPDPSLPGSSSLPCHEFKILNDGNIEHDRDRWVLWLLQNKGNVGTMQRWEDIYLYLKTTANLEATLASPRSGKLRPRPLSPQLNPLPTPPPPPQPSASNRSSSELASLVMESKQQVSNGSMDDTTTTPLAETSSEAPTPGQAALGLNTKPHQSAFSQYPNTNHEGRRSNNSPIVLSPKTPPPIVVDDNLLTSEHCSPKELGGGGIESDDSLDDLVLKAQQNQKQQQQQPQLITPPSPMRQARSAIDLRTLKPNSVALGLDSPLGSPKKRTKEASSDRDDDLEGIHIPSPQMDELVTLGVYPAPIGEVKVGSHVTVIPPPRKMSL